MNPFEGLQTPDIGKTFRDAYEHGMATRRENDTRNAMAQYAMNPNDPKAYEALAQANPQMAMQARGQQQQQALAAVEQHKEAILAGAKIFRSLGVKDEASYQQALGLARQYGIPLDDVPPNYDPQYVEGITHLADAFDPAKQDRSPASVQEYEYAKQQGYGGSYMDFEESKRGPIPVNNGDGTITFYQRNMLSQQPPQGGGNVPPPPPGFVIEGGPTGEPSGNFPR